MLDAQEILSQGYDRDGVEEEAGNETPKVWNEAGPGCQKDGGEQEDGIRLEEED